MIRVEIIDHRIKALQDEANQLINSHQALVQQVSNNQARFQQLKGAITELMSLKTQTNGEKPQ